MTRAVGLRTSGRSLGRESRIAPRPHVVFTVGGVTFAFDALHARYVLRARDAVADAVVAFLGQPYPVVDLRQAFGHPAPADTGFVLLVESDARAGLHIDDLCGLRAIDAADLAPLPAVYRGPERHWVAGLAATDDGPIVVTRIRELLDALLPVNAHAGGAGR